MTDNPAKYALEHEATLRRHLATENAAEDERLRRLYGKDAPAITANWGRGMSVKRLVEIYGAGAVRAALGQAAGNI